MEKNSPTRERVLALLRGRPSGMTVGELSSALELKHNGVRKHLATLTRHGLFSAERVGAPGIGRPPTRYRIAGRAEPGYAERALARLLLSAAAGVEPREAEQIAFESTQTFPGATIDDTLGALGFAPTDVTREPQRRAGGRTIELRACPFLELVARPHGKLICAFHRGLVRRDMPVGSELHEFRIAPSGPRCRIVLARSVRLAGCDEPPTTSSGTRTRSSG
jgi:predicted ArsR family transcriptional regulator